MIKKVAVMLIYITIIIIIMLRRDIIIDWVKQDHEYEWIWFSIAAILIGIVPITPYGIIGALIGAKYGAFLGGLINVMCSTISALILFILVRYLFQEKGRSLLAKSKYIELFTLWIERYPFFAIMMGRMIPFIPAVIINCYTALSRVRLIKFMLATFIGKLPVMLLFSLIGTQLIHKPERVPITLFIYSIIVIVLIICFKKIEKKFTNSNKYTS